MDVTSGVATFNLVAQVVLMVTLLTASVLALKGKLVPHCRTMRAAIVGQLLLIGIIMAPQVGRYYGSWSGLSSFTALLIVHHVFGGLAIILAIYVNLAVAGIVKRPLHLAWVMRATLATWSVSLGLGIYLFWYLWR